jgi:hypothetical protein
MKMKTQLSKFNVFSLSIILLSACNANTTIESGNQKRASSLSQADSELNQDTKSTVNGSPFEESPMISANPKTENNSNVTMENNIPPAGNNNLKPNNNMENLPKPVENGGIKPQNSAIIPLNIQNVLLSAKNISIPDFAISTPKILRNSKNKLFLSLSCLSANSQSKNQCTVSGTQNLGPIYNIQLNVQFINQFSAKLFNQPSDGISALRITELEKDIRIWSKMSAEKPIGLERQSDNNQLLVLKYSAEIFDTHVARYQIYPIQGQN